MDLIMSPQISYVETIIPSMTIFGERVWKDGIKVKQGNDGGFLIQ